MTSINKINVFFVKFLNQNIKLDFKKSEKHEAANFLTTSLDTSWLNLQTDL